MKNPTVNHVEETHASALNHSFSTMKQINQASTKVSSEVSGELAAIFDMLTPHNSSRNFQSQMNDDHGGKIFGCGSKTVVLHHSSF